MPVSRLPLLQCVHTNYLISKVIGRIREMTLMTGQGLRYTSVVSNLSTPFSQSFQSPRILLSFITQDKCFYRPDEIFFSRLCPQPRSALLILCQLASTDNVDLGMDSEKFLKISFNTQLFTV